MIAPIVLFVHRRPDHTRRTIESLLLNNLAENSELIIFSDAARNSEQKPAVDSVRAYLKTICGFRNISIHYRPENYGLAKSVIEGVNQVLNEHERIIVLEDDMLTSKYFLTYMNEALDRYAENDNVISIHGYLYPVKRLLPEAFFLPGADCWGWATWRRSWKLFNPDGQALLNELESRKLIKAFDFNGAYPYANMLKSQIKGTNNSWAIRWYASAFLANKLTLYPGRSLIYNIGNDSSGTHCNDVHTHDVILSFKPIDLRDVEVVASAAGQAAFEEFFRETRSGWVKSILLYINRKLARLRDEYN